MKIKLKKILFISPTGTFDNGAEVSIFNLMKQLVHLGYSVTNIAPGSSIQKKNYERQCLLNKIDVKFIESARWWWEDSSKQQTSQENLLADSYRNTIRTIKKVIDDKKIDIVITNTINIYTGALAAAISEVPHFWLVHEKPENEFSFLSSKLDFIKEYGDQIYCVTGDLTVNMKKLLHSETIKSFIPISAKPVYDLKHVKSKRLVSVGRLTKRKNQLELIKAYSNIQNSENIPLVFIGGWDKEYKNLCDNFISVNKIRNIEFLGLKKDPWSYLTDKDICILPSRSETFGLVYVEALSLGIPVILSDNPGHISAYNIFKDGELYKLNDIEDLSQKIEYMISNFLDMKKKYEDRKKEVSNNFNSEVCYKEILSDIELDIKYTSKSIRHISKLLTINSKKSKLANFEFKIRIIISKILNKVFH